MEWNWNEFGVYTFALNFKCYAIVQQSTFIRIRNNKFERRKNLISTKKLSDSFLCLKKIRIRNWCMIKQGPHWDMNTTECRVYTSIDIDVWIPQPRFTAAFNQRNAVVLLIEAYNGPTMHLRYKNNLQKSFRNVCTSSSISHCLFKRGDFLHTMPFL